LTPLVNVWTDELRQVRLARHGLAEPFLTAFEIILPEEPAAAHTPRDRNADLLLRLFPLMLVMWSLAGALYPAIDVCAGEKERGTMETLLITPAARGKLSSASS